MSFQSFLLFIIYMIFVFSYTLYGYGKAINEGFCLNKIEGKTLSYSEATKPSVVQFESGVDGLISFDRYGCDRPYCVNVTDFIVNNDFASLKSSVLNLDKGVKVFTVERVPRTDYWSDVGQSAETFRMVYKTVVSDRQLTLDCFGSTYEDGALSWVKVRYEELFADVIYENVQKNCTFKRCTIKTQELTCELRNGSDKVFVLVSLASVAILLLFLFVSKFSVNLRVILKKMFDFFSLDPMNNFKFCNPLNDCFGEFKAGEKCFKIRGDYSPFPEGIEADSLTSPNYFFKITGSKLTIIRRSSSSLVYSNDLSQIKARQVKFLLYWLNVNLKFWVTNDSTSHYLEMSEFSHFLDSGDLHLSYESCEKDSCPAGLGVLEMMTSFFSLKTPEAKTMLAHNRNFFGSLNLPALFNVLNNKTCWTDRPYGVGNSQWKRYTNDLCLLSISLGRGGFFCQSKGKKLSPPTDSLKKSIANNDCSFIEEKLDFCLSDQPVLNKIKGFHDKLEEVIKSRERETIASSLQHCILGHERMTREEIFKYIEDRDFDIEKIRSETISKCKEVSGFDIKKLKAESLELEKKLLNLSLREKKGRPVDPDLVESIRGRQESVNSMLERGSSLPPSYKSVLMRAEGLKKNDPSKLKEHLNSSLEEKVKIIGGEVSGEVFASNEIGVLKNSQLLFKVIKRKKKNKQPQNKGVVKRTINFLNFPENTQKLHDLIHNNPYCILGNVEAESLEDCSGLSRGKVVLSEFSKRNPVEKILSDSKKGKGKNKGKNEPTVDDKGRYRVILKKCVEKKGLIVENVDTRAYGGEKKKFFCGAPTKVVIPLRSSAFNFSYKIFWNGKEFYSVGNLLGSPEDNPGGDSRCWENVLSKFSKLKVKLNDSLDITKINLFLNEYTSSLKKILLS